MSREDEWLDEDSDEEGSFHDTQRGRSEAFDDETFEPRKKGMSTGSKVLIIMLCVGGGFFLLCCGGVVYLFMNIKTDMSEDPDVAAQATRDIVDIDIPQTLRPSRSLYVEAFQFKMNMVVYEREETSGLLLLMQMDLPIGNQAQQRAEMRQRMNEREMGQRKLVIKDSEIREYEIRGETVEFIFSEAVDPNTDTAYREVTGSFPGKNGAAFLLFQVKSDAYDENEITKMIESIR